MTHNYIDSRNNTVKLVYIAALVALSFIGSLIKIEGTIALDSMPGFFAALFLDPISGALVGGIGHLLTSFTSGFPLTLPIHIIIMAIMAISIYIFGWIYQGLSKISAIIIAIILNGIGAVVLLAPITVKLALPLSGRQFIYAMMGPLSLASGVNIILAIIVYRIIENKY